MSASSSLIARRVAIAAVCVLCLAGALGLAWWQWERFSSAGGTFQNLGYVLQWPLFGLFPAFMFWRIRRLRQQAAAQDATENTTEKAPAEPPAEAASPPPPVVSPSPQRPSPKPVPAEDSEDSADPEDPEDPEDAELAAYNRYLAELNAREAENKR